MVDSRNVSVTEDKPMMPKELHLALALTGLVHETSRLGKAFNFININLQKIVVHCNALVTS